MAPIMICAVCMIAFYQILHLTHPIVHIESLSHALEDGRRVRGRVAGNLSNRTGRIDGLSSRLAPGMKAGRPVSIPLATPDADLRNPRPFANCCLAFLAHRLLKSGGGSIPWLLLSGW